MRRAKPREAYRSGKAGLSSHGIRASSQGVLVECKEKRWCGGLAGASSDKRLAHAASASRPINSPLPTANGSGARRDYRYANVVAGPLDVAIR
jgi:hypothetical protein